MSSRFQSQPSGSHFHRATHFSYGGNAACARTRLTRTALSLSAACLIATPLAASDAPANTRTAVAASGTSAEPNSSATQADSAAQTRATTQANPATHTIGNPLQPGITPENLPLHEHESGDTLHISLQLGYESLYVASGMQSAYGSVQSNVELSAYGFTVGIWGNNPLDAQDNNPYGPFGAEYQLYGNYEIALGELVHASLGFTYYMHPREGSTPNRQREINLGLGADMLLHPELIYNYDFDLQQHDVAIAISHEESLDQWLPLEGFSIGATILAGYLHADKPESNQAPSPQDSMSYAYTEIAVNFIYTYKEQVSFYAGPRFAANDSSEGNIADRKANFWWGAGCSIHF